ncbi:hypothetical protein CR513_00450, partial [Mucuna pruriens]
MIMKDDGDIESESFKEEASNLGSEEYSNEKVSYEEELLMVRKLMSAFVEDDQPQKKNIFSFKMYDTRKVFRLY